LKSSAFILKWYRVALYTVAIFTLCAFIVLDQNSTLAKIRYDIEMERAIQRRLTAECKLFEEVEQEEELTMEK